MAPAGYANQHPTAKEAANGRLVWQKYNCQSCHQLYGLGGYLGPDLTNLMSAPGKDSTYLRAVLGSGIKQMPVFKLSDEEFSLLLAFLDDVNQSGNASPRSFEKQWFGMIKEKNHE